MQTAYSLDSESVKKIKRSAVVVLAGITLVVLPFFTKELTDFIMTSDPIDWRTMVTMALGGISTWIANTIKEYAKGETVKS